MKLYSKIALLGLLLFAHDSLIHGMDDEINDENMNDVYKEEEKKFEKEFTENFKKTHVLYKNCSGENWILQEDGYSNFLNRYPEMTNAYMKCGTGLPKGHLLFKTFLPQNFYNMVNDLK